MYLVNIDKKSGFVIIDELNDGIMAINDFRNLIEDKEFGIQCFTCVALSVDYSSPIRYYSYKERPKKAMRSICGSSNYYPWGNDLIQKACITYQELQYNSTLEQDEAIKQLIADKLIEIKETETSSGREAKMQELARYKKLEAEFRKTADFEKELQEAPTINGYSLSRLEQKANEKKSFYHERKQREQESERKKQRAREKEQSNEPTLEGKS